MQNRAKLWREKARQQAIAGAVFLTLPSGAEILARRPGPSWFAAQQRLPVGLAAAATGVQGGDPSDEQIADMIGFLRRVMEYSVLDPAISLTPGPDEMHPSEIPDEDSAYIIRWAMRGVEAAELAEFRAVEPDGGVGGGGAHLRAAPVDAAGDCGSGVGVGAGSGGLRYVPTDEV